MKPRALVLLALLTPAATPAPAMADSHAITVANTGIETIRSIAIGAGGENRLRSQVPPGAQARVTYSTGCTADVKIGYDSGRMETFAGVDICSDPKIATGQGVLGGTSNTAATGITQQADVSRSAPATAKAVASTRPSLPAVPPWTGKSITKRFGGLD